MLPSLVPGTVVDTPPDSTCRATGGPTLRGHHAVNCIADALCILFEEHVPGGGPVQMRGTEVGGWR
jgi:hypothetical protein